MPVHFAGLPVDMERLYAIAARHRLRVIEDAAHAIGSPGAGGASAASATWCASASIPNKNMTTIEGGAISGGSAEELKAIELHRWHGQVKSGLDGFDTLLAGGKYNLSDVAAAVGLGQLRRLEEFNARRRALVARYYELWGEAAPLRLPERGDEGHSWHVFTPLLPLAAAVDLRAPSSWRRCRRAASAWACTTRRSTCSAPTAHSATARGSSRTPSASGARR